MKTTGIVDAAVFTAQFGLTNQNGWCRHNGTGIAIPGLVVATTRASKPFLDMLLRVNYCLHHHLLQVTMKDTCRAQQGITDELMCVIRRRTNEPDTSDVC